MKNILFISIFIFYTMFCEATTYEVNRLNENEPIITQSMFVSAGASKRESRNINGPSVIRVPQWLKDSDDVADPSANYYLYFGHHGGNYIRMAWAENIEGPYHLYRVNPEIPIEERGVLALGENDTITIDGEPFIEGHIASPYALVDEDNQRIILYFHGVYNGQKTFVATSANGLNFNLPENGGQPGHGVRKVFVSAFYLYPFNYKGQGYGFTNMGRFWRAPQNALITDDEAISPPYNHRLWSSTEGPIRITHDNTDDGDGDALEQKNNPRHFGLRFSSNNPDQLHVFFTRRNDAPERILLQKIDLSQSEDWKNWTEASWPPEEIMRPLLDWEGADLPITTSENGSATNVRELRDPHIFEDIDGRIYLFYTGRGEEAIGVAELIENESTGAWIEVR